MNVVHLVLLLVPVGGDVWSIFCCIFCLKLIMMLSGKLLHLAISSMVVHSLLHLVGSSILLYLIDDAWSNKNQVSATIRQSSQTTSYCTVWLLNLFTCIKTQQYVPCKYNNMFSVLKE